MIVNKLISGGGSGMRPTIVVTAPTGSTVTCDGVAGTETPILNPVWRGLPSGYTQVEYIESSGTQYIDTGIIPNQNTVSQIKFKNLSVTGGAIYGYEPDSDTNDYRFFNYNSQIYLDFPSGLRINGSTCYANTTYEFEIGNYYVKNVGASSNLISGSTVSSFTGVASITLNKSGIGSPQYSSNRWYYVKIYQDGSTLSADLVPCLNVSTGKYGMYDLVTSTFIGDGNGGTFTAGAEVPHYISGTWAFTTTVGTHTLSATLGTKSATKSVVVDTTALYNVTLVYKLYLYNEGDECTSVTGGWRTYPYGIASGYSAETASFNTDNIVLASNSSSSCAIDTNNKINVTNYSSLKIDAVATFVNESYQRIGLRNTNTGYYDSDFVAYIGDEVITGTRAIHSLDISSLTGEYYIFCGEHLQTTLTIYCIWLE